MRDGDHRCGNDAVTGPQEAGESFTVADAPSEDRHEPMPNVAEGAGGEKILSRYPVARIQPFSDIGVMLELAAPGIRHQYEEHADGRRAARMSQTLARHRRRLRRSGPAHRAGQSIHRRSRSGMMARTWAA
ncbi:hypothetical protein ABZ297_24230 [Nonomuraea sp. NPDC005983]|uniref:hypothetical protein n=1 Tax=Nonomuraea sp. NPDC005983 TaxID=3155595 RepID=UPI0033B03494